MCIARRRARGHSSSHPREPDAKPAHRQRHGPTRRQSAASRAGGHGACTPSERPSALGRTRPSTRRCTRQGRRCGGSFGGRGVWPQRPFQVFGGRGVWRQKASTNLDARTPFGQHPTEGHDRDDSKPPWATPRCVFLRPVGVHHRVAGKHMFSCSLQVYTTKSLVKTCFPTARRCVGIGFTAEPPWATPQRRHLLHTLLNISL